MADGLAGRGVSDRIGPTRTRILLMVLDGYARSQPPKIADLMAATGVRSKNGVHEHLVGLRKHGLIDWQDGRAGTVVPLCRFISPEDLAAATDGPAAE